MYEVINDVNKIAEVITTERAEYTSLCPALREAAAYLQGTHESNFVAAAVSLGINPSTASIQFRKSRAFWAGCDTAEAQGGDALESFIKAWRW